MKRGKSGAWGSEFDAVEIYVGANVGNYRRTRGLTQERLAEIVGLEVKSLQRIESGLGNSTARVLAALARALGTSIDALFMPAELAPRKRGRPRKVDPTTLAVTEGLQPSEQAQRAIAFLLRDAAAPEAPMPPPRKRQPARKSTP